MAYAIPYAVLAVIFVATLVRSAFGFGEALVAVPLLAFLMPLADAAPLAVLVSILIAAVVVVQDWRAVRWPGAAGLVAATLPGIPLGILLLASPRQGFVRGLLGVLLIAFAAFSLAGRRPAPRRSGESRGWLLACGFAAGILGGAYGMNGPPLVVYGTLRGWPPPQFRATLQGYFLPASLAGLAAFWLAGLWTPALGNPATRDFLLALPVMLPAVGLGRTLNRRLPALLFHRILYVALLAIGALLLR